MEPSLTARGALALLFFATATPARADEAPYCRKAHARAASDAALLMAPRFVLQGIRFPSTGQLDIGLTTGTGYQARAALTFSPLDLYRGLRVLRVGDADCLQHETSGGIERILAQGTDAARLVALREQVTFLNQHREEWRAVRSRAEERLSARVVTLVEFDEVRRQADALEHKLVETHGEASEIEARRPDPPRGSLGALAREYAERSLAAEREIWSLRALDAWQVQLTGGVIPIRPVDWYGVAEVSFNLGGLVRPQHEDAYMAAKTDELRDARYELGARLRDFRNQVAAAVEQARRDLEVADRQVVFLENTRVALEKSDAQSVAQARDVVTIEELSVQSDAVFLRALVGALSVFLEGDHGD
jgi:hypothetical protein